MISKLKITKGHPSVKTVDGIIVLIFFTSMTMLYISIKFHENFLQV